MILCVHKRKRASLYDLAKTDFLPSVLHDITIEKQVDISVVCIGEQDGHTNSHDNGHELACSVQYTQMLEVFKQGQQSVAVKDSGYV